MGYREVNLTIVGQRSSHNSLQDRIDIVKWEWLRDQLQDWLEREDMKSLQGSVTLDLG
jgi:hypothetical protein